MRGVATEQRTVCALVRCAMCLSLSCFSCSSACLMFVEGVRAEWNWAEWSADSLKCALVVLGLTALQTSVGGSAGCRICSWTCSSSCTTVSYSAPLPALWLNLCQTPCSRPGVVCSRHGPLLVKVTKRWNTARAQKYSRSTGMGCCQLTAAFAPALHVPHRRQLLTPTPSTSKHET